MITFSFTIYNCTVLWDQYANSRITKITTTVDGIAKTYSDIAANTVIQCDAGTYVTMYHNTAGAWSWRLVYGGNTWLGTHESIMFKTPSELHGATSGDFNIGWGYLGANRHDLNLDLSTNWIPYITDIHCP